MVCECETCYTKSPAESLVPVSMYNVIFNQRGKTMLPITDHIVDSDQVARFPNILSFEQFKQILGVRLNIISKINDKNHILRVYRAALLDPDLMDKIAEPLVENIYKHIPHANITIRKNVAYFMTERTTPISEEELKKRTIQIFGDIGTMKINMDYLEYDMSSDPNDFISLI